MQNHDEKHKDMIESVLPSTSRKLAQERRRRLHKQARTRQRIVLTAITASYDDADFDFREGRRKSELHWMVLDRRGAGNVGALTRWAAAIVAANPTLRDAPLHEQVAHFATMLPADIIGQHAVQHIEWALKCLAERPYRSARRAQRPAQSAEHKREMRDGLRRILAQGPMLSSTARCARRMPGAVLPAKCRSSCGSCWVPTTSSRS